ncbi:unnamed protein product [Parnassius mnemosyne]|uniref:Uncharacterized protein n=1 Tax=Parnassius mnemosyne TaxID=213953 RepID=A0AAV1LWY8_9NEOP
MGKLRFLRSGVALSDPGLYACIPERGGWPARWQDREDVLSRHQRKYKIGPCVGSGQRHRKVRASGWRMRAMRRQKWKRARDAGARVLPVEGAGASAAAGEPSASELHEADSASERVEGREREALVSPASHYL